MARTLAPVTVLVLLFGCFKPGADDDEIGATEDTTDTSESGTTETESSTSDTEGTTDTTDTTDDMTTGPECGPGVMACGDECVDTDIDPAHCGACDHDCQGGDCVAGTCQQVELFNGKGRLFMVLVDNLYIYYGGDGVDVGRMDKDGSNDTILVAAGADPPTQEWCYSWALTPNAIVWGNDWVQPGVRGCIRPDCMGGVQTFVPGLNLHAMTFNQTNDTLYYDQGDEIDQRPWPGGMPSLFITPAGNPRSMAFDAEFIYWSAAISANQFDVRKSPVAGGPFVELVLNRPMMGDIAVGADYVYWAEGPQIYFAELPNGIGGGVPPEFGNSGADVRFMAHDLTHVYWTSSAMDAGSVQRCPIDGCVGEPEVLGETPQPWGIALDQDAVYWVTEMGGIYKVAK